jgi:hypothetical protein
VEVDWALGGFGLEVGCKGSQAEATKMRMSVRVQCSENDAK